ncbi:MAG: hypothetical protein IJ759_05215 [Bacteroidales bacterium]|nr:hypothetical protein [Bacteroidales bacterium]
MKRFFLLAIASLFALSVFSQTQHPENCPFGGVVDCTGQCGLFVDENGDGFCDNAVLSKNNKDTKEDTKKQEQQNEKAVNSSQKADNGNKTAPKKDVTTQVENNIANNSDTKGNDSAETLSGATQTMTESTEKETPTIEMPKQERKFPYHFWQVLIATLGLYCCSAVLVKTKTIKKVNHRRLWNAILGITCLVSCLIGVYVVFAKMYGWSMNYLTLMQLHVDFGVSMTVVAIIHILWHLNYWKNLFKSAGKKT